MGNRLTSGMSDKADTKFYNHYFKWNAARKSSKSDATGTTASKAIGFRKLFGPTSVVGFRESNKKALIPGQGK